MSGHDSSDHEREVKQPHLKRVLGRWDLVLLFVVAVFNLNVVPSIAANGGVTVWLWIISLVLFFWPQGIAVIELAHRYPGEGGVYLWAKEVFGDFHGFLSGWCYWTNNMLYVPTIMLYFVGVSVFVLGPGHQSLADNKVFALGTSLLLLVLLVVLNIVGLGIGKWINNVGAIGTGIAAFALIGLGLIVWLRYGTTVTAADFRIPPNPRFVLNSFGVPRSTRTIKRPPLSWSNIAISSAMRSGLLIDTSGTSLNSSKIGASSGRSSRPCSVVTTGGPDARAAGSP